MPPRLPSPWCWRCSAGFLAAARTAPSRRPFTMTAMQLAEPPPPPMKKNAWTRKPTGKDKKKGPKHILLAKNERVRSGGSLAPGERKAHRRRVVLTNPNALEVPGLKLLERDTAVAEGARGSIVILPDPLVEQLRELGAFKQTQQWRAFRKPAVLLTEQSLDLGRRLIAAEERKAEGVVRNIVSGDKGVGKSVMLLQAMAMALLRGWVVISLPECQDLTIAHTEYAPLRDSSPMLYYQREYTASLLAAIARANDPVLSELELSKQHDVGIPLQSNMSLRRLAEIGGSDPDIAWPVFRALWDELTTPSVEEYPPHRRPPILLTADGISHLMGLSLYRDASFELIHAHRLALVEHFVAYLSGARSLPNGGAVLGATSRSNRLATTTFSLALSQLEARAAGVEEGNVPQPDPFERYDDKVLEVMNKVGGLIKLERLSTRDTKTLLEYYAASGILREVVDNNKVAEKWAVGGGGIIGEVERAALIPRW